MQDGYYQNSIYPFQDKILEIVDRANVDFYLTGGTALSRLEAKDLADIVYVARSYVFDWEKIIYEARMKDLWVDPLEICRIINDFPIHMLKPVRWINSVDLRDLEEDLLRIHDDIFYGRKNSLANG